MRKERLLSGSTGRKSFLTKFLFGGINGWSVKFLNSRFASTEAQGTLSVDHDFPDVRLHCRGSAASDVPDKLTLQFFPLRCT
jgi:hypothetical protein